MTRLMLRRSNMLLAVETALETLTDAGQLTIIPRYDLIRQFRKMTESLHRWYLPPEQQIGLRVYQPIIGKLMSLPNRQEGSPDPVVNFIAEETAMLRSQRVALVRSATQPRRRRSVRSRRELIYKRSTRRAYASHQHCDPRARRIAVP